MKRNVFILYFLTLLILCSCASETNRPEISIEPIVPEVMPSESVQETAAPPLFIEGETFSYLEFTPRDNLVPHFSMYFACEENYIKCVYKEGTSIRYGFMDFEFNEITGPISDIPSVFKNGLCYVEDGDNRIVYDLDFEPVEFFDHVRVAYKNQLALLTYFSPQDDLFQNHYRVFDFEKYIDLTSDSLLIPVASELAESNTGHKLYGYKKFEDVYINKVENEEAWVLDPLFSGADWFENGFAIVHINHENACINLEGTIIIPPNGNQINILNENLISTYVKNTDPKIPYYNFVEIFDSTGKPLSGFNERIVSITPFYNGFASVYLESGKSIVIDEHGEIKFNEYNADGYFSDGLMRVVDEDGFFFIDLSGNPITDKRYIHAEPFSDGFAKVMGDNYLIGYINTRGELAIECKFENAGHFDKGFALVKGENPGGFIIDESGKAYLEELAITHLSKFSDEGYALAMKQGTDEKDTKYYLIKINE